MRKQMAGILCGLMMAAAGVMTAQADDWALSDDGKHWMYMESPGDPVKDEWIEDGEKLYYVDAKGYMKTGWVTNKEEGKKYYMGPDGAMAFTPLPPTAAMWGRTAPGWRRMTNTGKPSGLS